MPFDLDAVRRERPDLTDEDILRDLVGKFGDVPQVLGPSGWGIPPENVLPTYVAELNRREAPKVSRQSAIPESKVAPEASPVPESPDVKQGPISRSAINLPDTYQPPGPETYISGKEPTKDRSGALGSSREALEAITGGISGGAGQLWGKSFSGIRDISTLRDLQQLEQQNRDYSGFHPGEAIEEGGGSLVYEPSIQTAQAPDETFSRKSLMYGLSSLGTQIGVSAPLAVVPGGQLVGVPLVYGLAQAHDTYYEALKAGHAPVTAAGLALVHGTWEGAIEAIGQRVFLGLFKFGRMEGMLETPVKDAAKSTIRKLLSREGAKGFAKALALEIPSEVGEELAQGGGGAKLYEWADIDKDAWETFKKQIPVTIGSTIIATALYATGGKVMQNKMTQRAWNGVTNPDASPEEKLEGINFVYNHLEKGDPEAAKQFKFLALKGLKEGNLPPVDIVLYDYLRAAKQILPKTKDDVLAEGGKIDLATGRGIEVSGLRSGLDLTKQEFLVKLKALEESDVLEVGTETEMQIRQELAQYGGLDALLQSEGKTGVLNDMARRLGVNFVATKTAAPQQQTAATQPQQQTATPSQQQKKEPDEISKAWAEVDKINKTASALEKKMKTLESSIAALGTSPETETGRQQLEAQLKATQQEYVKVAGEQIKAKHAYAEARKNRKSEYESMNKESQDKLHADIHSTIDKSTEEGRPITFKSLYQKYKKSFGGKADLFKSTLEKMGLKPLPNYKEATYASANEAVREKGREKFRAKKAEKRAVIDRALEKKDELTRAIDEALKDGPVHVTKIYSIPEVQDAAKEGKGKNVLNHRLAREVLKELGLSIDKKNNVYRAEVIKPEQKTEVDEGDEFFRNIARQAISDLEGKTEENATFDIGEEEIIQQRDEFTDEGETAEERFRQDQFIPEEEGTDIDGADIEGPEVSEDRILEMLNSLDPKLAEEYQRKKEAGEITDDPNRGNLNQLVGTTNEDPIEELNSIMISFLENNGFNVRDIPSSNLSKHFGIPVKAVTSILTKMVYVASDKATIDTLPEEAGHVFWDLFLLSYKRTARAGLRKEIKALLELHEGEFFTDVIRKYKDAPGYTMDMIVDEAMGQLIGQAIVSNFKAQTTKSETMWAKIKSFFTRIMNMIRARSFHAAAFMDIGANEMYSNELRDLANISAKRILVEADILGKLKKDGKGSYNIDKSLDKILGDTGTIDFGNGKLILKFIHKMQENGYNLGGSAALSRYGTIHRENSMLPHDLDFGVFGATLKGKSSDEIGAKFRKDLKAFVSDIWPGKSVYVINNRDFDDLKTFTIIDRSTFDNLDPDAKSALESGFLLPPGLEEELTEENLWLVVDIFYKDSYKAPQAFHALEFKFDKAREKDVADIANYEFHLYPNELYDIAPGLPRNFFQVDKEHVPTEPYNPPVQSEYQNHSGGAAHGDTLWDQIGRKFGFVNHTHWREPGTSQVDSKILQRQGVKATPMSATDYAEGIQKASSAARKMRRGISKEYGKYQYRNWAQVKNSDAVFAVATIVEPGALGLKGYVNKANFQVVDGGTGNTVMMAINEGKPVFVYDFMKEGWFTWNGERFVATEIPSLTKNYAGIGDHKIPEKFLPGVFNAIKTVYIKTIAEGPMEFEKIEETPKKPIVRRAKKGQIAQQWQIEEAFVPVEIKASPVLDALSRRPIVEILDEFGEEGAFAFERVGSENIFSQDDMGVEVSENLSEDHVDFVTVDRAGNISTVRLTRDFLVERGFIYHIRKSKLRRSKKTVEVLPSFPQVHENVEKAQGVLVRKWAKYMEDIKNPPKGKEKEKFKLKKLLPGAKKDYPYHITDLNSMVDAGKLFMLSLGGKPFSLTSETRSESKSKERPEVSTIERTGMPKSLRLLVALIKGEETGHKDGDLGALKEVLRRLGQGNEDITVTAAAKLLETKRGWYQTLKSGELSIGSGRMIKVKGHEFGDYIAADLYSKLKTLTTPVTWKPFIERAIELGIGNDARTALATVTKRFNESKKKAKGTTGLRYSDKETTWETVDRVSTEIEKKALQNTENIFKDGLSRFTGPKTQEEILMEIEIAGLQYSEWEAEAAIADEIDGESYEQAFRMLSTDLEADEEEWGTVIQEMERAALRAKSMEEFRESLERATQTTDLFHPGLDTQERIHVELSMVRSEDLSFPEWEEVWSHAFQEVGELVGELRVDEKMTEAEKITKLVEAIEKTPYFNPNDLSSLNIQNIISGGLVMDQVLAVYLRSIIQAAHDQFGGYNIDFYSWVADKFNPQFDVQTIVDGGINNLTRTKLYYETIKDTIYKPLGQRRFIMVQKNARELISQSRFVSDAEYTGTTAKARGRQKNKFWDWWDKELSVRMAHWARSKAESLGLAVVEGPNGEIYIDEYAGADMETAKAASMIESLGIVDAAKAFVKMDDVFVSRIIDMLTKEGKLKRAREIIYDGIFGYASERLAVESAIGETRLSDPEMKLFFGLMGWTSEEKRNIITWKDKKDRNIFHIDHFLGRLYRSSIGDLTGLNTKQRLTLAYASIIAAKALRTEGSREGNNFYTNFERYLEEAAPIAEKYLQQGEKLFRGDPTRTILMVRLNKILHDESNRNLLKFMDEEGEGTTTLTIAHELLKGIAKVSSSSPKFNEVLYKKFSSLGLKERTSRTQVVKIADVIKMNLDHLVEERIRGLTKSRHARVMLDYHTGHFQERTQYTTYRLVSKKDTPETLKTAIKMNLKHYDRTQGKVVTTEELIVPVVKPINLTREVPLSAHRIRSVRYQDLLYSEINKAGEVEKVIYDEQLDALIDIHLYSAEETKLNINGVVQWVPTVWLTKEDEKYIVKEYSVSPGVWTEDKGKATDPKKYRKVTQSRFDNEFLIEMRNAKDDRPFRVPIFTLLQQTEAVLRGQFGGRRIMEDEVKAIADTYLKGHLAGMVMAASTAPEMPTLNGYISKIMKIELKSIGKELWAMNLRETVSGSEGTPTQSPNQLLGRVLALMKLGTMFSTVHNTLSTSAFLRLADQLWHDNLIEPVYAELTKPTLLAEIDSDTNMSRMETMYIGEMMKALVPTEMWMNMPVTTIGLQLLGKRLLLNQELGSKIAVIVNMAAENAMESGRFTYKDYKIAVEKLILDNTAIDTIVKEGSHIRRGEIEGLSQKFKEKIYQAEVAENEKKIWKIAGIEPELAESGLDVPKGTWGKFKYEDRLFGDETESARWSADLSTVEGMDVPMTQSLLEHYMKMFSRMFGGFARIELRDKSMLSAELMSHYESLDESGKRKFLIKQGYSPDNISVVWTAPGREVFETSLSEALSVIEIAKELSEGKFVTTLGHEGLHTVYRIVEFMSIYHPDLKVRESFAAIAKTLSGKDEEVRSREFGRKLLEVVNGNDAFVPVSERTAWSRIKEFFTHLYRWIVDYKLAYSWATAKTLEDMKTFSLEQFFGALYEGRISEAYLNAVEKGMTKDTFLTFKEHYKNVNKDQMVKWAGEGAFYADLSNTVRPGSLAAALRLEAAIAVDSESFMQKRAVLETILTRATLLTDRLEAGKVTGPHAGLIKTLTTISALYHSGLGYSTELHLAAAEEIARELNMVEEHGGFYDSKNLTEQNKKDIESLAESIRKLGGDVPIQAAEAIKQLSVGKPLNVANRISLMMARMNVIFKNHRSVVIPKAQRDQHFFMLQEKLDRAKEAVSGGHLGPIWTQASEGNRLIKDGDPLHLALIETQGMAIRGANYAAATTRLLQDMIKDLTKEIVNEEGYFNKIWPKVPFASERKKVYDVFSKQVDAILYVYFEIFVAPKVNPKMMRTEAMLKFFDMGVAANAAWIDPEIVWLVNSARALDEKMKSNDRLNRDVMKILNAITKEYRDLHKFGFDMGVIWTRFLGFLPRSRAAQKDSGVAPAAMSKTGTAHAMPRTYMDLMSFWIAGNKLKRTTLTGAYQQYVNDIFASVANKKLISKMMGINATAMTKEVLDSANYTLWSDGNRMFSMDKNVNGLVYIAIPGVMLWREVGARIDSANSAPPVVDDNEKVHLVKADENKVKPGVEQYAILRQEPLFVHPKVWHRLGYIFSEGGPENVVADKLYALNIFVKRSIFLSSFFHHFAFSREFPIATPDYWSGTAIGRWLGMKNKVADTLGINFLNPFSSSKAGNKILNTVLTKVVRVQNGEQLEDLLREEGFSANEIEFGQILYNLAGRHASFNIAGEWMESAKLEEAKREALKIGLGQGIPKKTLNFFVDAFHRNEDFLFKQYGNGLKAVTGLTSYYYLKRLAIEMERNGVRDWRAFGEGIWKSNKIVWKKKALFNPSPELQEYWKQFDEGVRAVMYEEWKENRILDMVADFMISNYGGMPWQKWRHSPNPLVRWWASPVSVTMQRIMLLAPDWTGSQLLTIMKGLSPSTHPLERKLYLRPTLFAGYLSNMAFRGALMGLAGNILVELINLLLKQFDDDETWRRKYPQAQVYEHFWDRIEHDWKMSVNTPVWRKIVRAYDIDFRILYQRAYRIAGGEPDMWIRRSFSPLGHITGILDIMADPARVAKNKMGFYPRVAYSLVSGSNFKGEIYTTWAEFMGTDYDSLRVKSDSQWHEEDDPNWGKWKGKLTKYGGDRPVGLFVEKFDSSRLFSASVDIIRSNGPMQFQEAMNMILGYTHYLDGASRMVGIGLESSFTPDKYGNPEAYYNRIQNDLIVSYTQEMLYHRALGKTPSNPEVNERYNWYRMAFASLDREMEEAGIDARDFDDIMEYIWDMPPLPNFKDYDEVLRSWDNFIIEQRKVTPDKRMY